MTGYTQYDGWARDFGPREPKSVRFTEPFYGTASPSFPIPPGKGIKLHIVIEPNDMGVAAFKDTPATMENGKLLLHWRGGELPYLAVE